MKFLAIADLHDREWVLNKIMAIATHKDYDALILAGDISYYFDFTYKVIELLKQIKKPCFYVPGNNESPEIEKIYDKNNFSVHEKVVKFKNYKIAGFGYSPITPFHTIGELKEEEIKERASKLDIDNKTIFITHCPPKGILDRGFGSTSLLEIIKQRKPLLNVFGHIHEIVGIEKHDGTYFINLPAAKDGKIGVINIEAKNNEDEKEIKLEVIDL
jgi:Icc-related predicted phosphoesterase